MNKFTILLLGFIGVLLVLSPTVASHITYAKKQSDKSGGGSSNGKGSSDSGSGNNNSPSDNTQPDNSQPTLSSDTNKVSKNPKPCPDGQPRDDKGICPPSLTTTQPTENTPTTSYSNMMGPCDDGQPRQDDGSCPTPASANQPSPCGNGKPSCCSNLPTSGQDNAITCGPTTETPPTTSNTGESTKTLGLPQPLGAPNGPATGGDNTGLPQPLGAPNGPATGGDNTGLPQPTQPSTTGTEPTTKTGPPIIIINTQPSKQQKQQRQSAEPLFTNQKSSQVQPTTTVMKITPDRFDSKMMSTHPALDLACAAAAACASNPAAAVPVFSAFANSAAACAAANAAAGAAAAPFPFTDCSQKPIHLPVASYTVSGVAPPGFGLLLTR